MMRKDAEVRMGVCEFCDDYPIAVLDGKTGGTICLQCATVASVALLEAMHKAGGGAAVCPTCLDPDYFNCPCTDVISRPKKEPNGN